MTTPTRRNDPCPCGSGLRYKECHGRLGEAVSPPSPETLVARALQLHRQGRLDEADRAYRHLLEREPGHAVATHYLGMIAWQRGDLASAERQMRAALAADASIADFHNNLALLLRDTGRLDEAIAGFRRTLAVDPRWFEAHNNLGLALEALGRWDEAIAQYRAAIAAEPRFAAARHNLGQALLATGAWAEGWEQYRWRHLAQGAATAPPAEGVARLPASLAGRRLALVAEQGIGDVLFFLRFAPELARRGARLAFRGDARLHAILARTGLFALGCAPEGAPASGLEALAVGDLPWLLAANDASRFPPALALAPLPDRAARMKARLEALGPAPCVALTWRAGVAPVGPARTQLKEVPLAALGAALRGIAANWVSVQRGPREGEREALEGAIGSPVHDFSQANEDLEDMLGLLASVRGYAGTSNANTHLGAGSGLAQQVLVPMPAEWRWLAAGERSPWFPAMTIHRQEASGAWEPALAQLARALAARLA